MGYQRITPEVEAAFGAKLRTAAFVAGHRPKLPPDVGRVRDYAPGSRKAQVLNIIQHAGAVTCLDIAAVLGMKSHQASCLLSLLRKDGKVKACGKKSGRGGPRMNAYELAGAE